MKASIAGSDLLPFRVSGGLKRVEFIFEGRAPSLDGELDATMVKPLRESRYIHPPLSPSLCRMYPCRRI